VILTAAAAPQGKARGRGAVASSRGASIPWDLHGLEQLEDGCTVLTAAPGAEEECDFIGKLERAEHGSNLDSASVNAIAASSYLLCHLTQVQITVPGA